MLLQSTTTRSSCRDRTQRNRNHVHSRRIITEAKELTPFEKAEKAQIKRAMQITSLILTQVALNALHSDKTSIVDKIESLKQLAQVANANEQHLGISA